MNAREQRIGKLVERIRKKSRNWNKPSIIVIGGYALRAYVPFSRYSRDCDFALPKGKGRKIDSVEKWLPELKAEAKEKADSFGYMRLIELVRVGKHKIKIALDFMEGEIRGRSGEAFLIDEKFVSRSTEKTIQIGELSIPVRIPSYQDYFLLKLLSARASDVRDLAVMIWKTGLPESESLIQRAREVVNEPTILRDKLKLILQDISDSRFVDSWRGTFVTREFGERERKKVLKELRQLEKQFAGTAF
jgi:hypothetical protein